MLIKLNYHTSERYLYGIIRCRTAEDFVGGWIFKQLRQPQVVILITCNSFFFILCNKFSDNGKVLFQLSENEVSNVKFLDNEQKFLYIYLFTFENQKSKIYFQQCII